MKKTTLLLLLSCAQMLYAQSTNSDRRTRMNPLNQQSKGTAKISGFVLDSISNKGVEFANIVLFNQQTNTLLDGTIADAQGKFSLEGLADGTYRLHITFLGYSSKTMGDIKIVREKALLWGNIPLAQGNTTLQEMTVTGRTALIEEKVDRLVYNAVQNDTNSYPHQYTFL
jgi:ferric enterobactin receptor